MTYMKKLAMGVALAASVALPVAANAGTKTVSGEAGGLSWSAQSTIVGQTSTATVAGGGNPLYFAPRPQYNGVVFLVMEYATSAFVCSGTLMNDRRSILTAAHCVSDGAGTANPLRTTAYFTNGGPDVVPSVLAPIPTVPSAFDPSSTGVSVQQYFVNESYTGEVIDQNDIAILRLSNLAPIWATSHGVNYDTIENGEEFNVAGYGARSTIGGAAGAVGAGTGRLRQGLNNYDLTLGDAAFGGFFTNQDANGERFFGFAEMEHSYISDFDNGLDANDATCLLTGAFTGEATFCNTGVGAREVGVAGGDSGGPQFVNGKVSSVTSYGLSFGTGFGDVDDNLNSSWGEYSGYVPTYIHQGFIQSHVPEPTTWAMLIAGFGLVGGAMRRRQGPKAVAA